MAFRRPSSERSTSDDACPDPAELRLHPHTNPFAPDDPAPPETDGASATSPDCPLCRTECLAAELELVVERIARLETRDRELEAGVSADDEGFCGWDSDDDDVCGWESDEGGRSDLEKRLRELESRSADFRESLWEAESKRADLERRQERLEDRVGELETKQDKTESDLGETVGEMELRCEKFEERLKRVARREESEREERRNGRRERPGSDAGPFPGTRLNVTSNTYVNTAPETRRDLA